jgi:transcriptional regulator GlxA family with amidase domain
MPRDIAILIFPKFQLLDAAGPLTALEEARRRTVPPCYRLRLIAQKGGLVVSSSGVQLMAESLIDDPLDTLIVAGGLGTGQASTCTETLAYIRAAAARARRIASVCSGAFVLAAAGVLDGKRVTTHWARAAELARAYPQVRVEPDRIFIRDGTVWTSAGVTAGIDLALALIAEDVGEPVAKSAAQQLVVYYRRPGGQSQFSALLEMDSADSRFWPVLSWAREHLDERLPVERLADRAAMSPRHFTRTFVRETGMTPAKAVERLRLEIARERIEGSSEPIENIAASTGFRDPERMRRAFIRAFGQPPQALRRAVKTSFALKSRQRQDRSHSRSQVGAAD